MSQTEHTQSYADVLEKSFRNKENTKKRENHETPSQPQPRKDEGLLIHCAKETINLAAKVKELLKKILIQLNSD